MPTLKPCGPNVACNVLIAVLRQVCDLVRLIGGHIDVRRNMAVRTHHEVAGVVGVQVQHDVGERPSGNNQADVRLGVRRPTERAGLASVVVVRTILALDVGEPIR